MNSNENYPKTGNNLPKLQIAHRNSNKTDCRYRIKTEITDTNQQKACIPLNSTKPAILRRNSLSLKKQQNKINESKSIEINNSKNKLKMSDCYLLKQKKSFSSQINMGLKIKIDRERKQENQVKQLHLNRQFLPQSQIQAIKNAQYTEKMKMLFCKREEKLLKLANDGDNYNKHGSRIQIQGAEISKQVQSNPNIASLVSGNRFSQRKSEISSASYNNESKGSSDQKNNMNNNIASSSNKNAYKNNNCEDSQQELEDNNNSNNQNTNKTSTSKSSNILSSSCQNSKPNFQNISFKPLKGKFKKNQKLKQQKLYLNSIQTMQFYLHNFMQSVRYLQQFHKKFPHYFTFMNFINNYEKNDGMQEISKRTKTLIYSKYNQSKLSNNARQSSLQKIKLIKQNIECKGNRQHRLSLPTSYFRFNTLAKPVDTQKLENYHPRKANKLWYIGRYGYFLLKSKPKPTDSCTYFIMVENPSNFNIFCVEISLHQSLQSIFNKIKCQQVHRYQWLNVQQVRNTARVDMPSCYQKNCLVLSHLYADKLHFLPIQQQIISSSNSDNEEEQLQNQKKKQNLKIMLYYENAHKLTTYKPSIIKTAFEIYLNKYFPNSNVDEKAVQHAKFKNLKQIQKNNDTNTSNQDKAKLEAKKQYKISKQSRRIEQKYGKFRCLINILQFYQQQLQFNKIKKQSNPQMRSNNRKVNIIKNRLVKKQQIDQAITDQKNIVNANKRLTPKLKEKYFLQLLMKLVPEQQKSINRAHQFNFQYVVDQDRLKIIKQSQRLYYQIFTTRVTQLDAKSNYQATDLNKNMNEKQNQPINQQYQLDLYDELETCEIYQILKRSSLAEYRREPLVKNLYGKKSSKVSKQALSAKYRHQPCVDRKICYNNILEIDNIYNGTLFVNGGGNYHGHQGKQTDNNKYIQQFYNIQSKNWHKTKYNQLHLMQQEQHKQKCLKHQTKISRNQTILVSIYTMSYKYRYKPIEIENKEAHNEASKQVRIKLIVLKTEKYVHSRNNIHLIMAIQYKQKQLASANELQRVLKTKLENSIIQNINDFKQQVLNFVADANYAKQVEGKTCGRGKIRLCLTSRSAIILNQSLLKPRISMSSLFHYSVIVKVKITSSSNSKLQFSVVNQPFFTKLTIYMYPQANFVFILCEFGKSCVKISLKKNDTHNDSKYCSQKQLQLCSKSYSICAYYDEFAKIVHSSYIKNTENLSQKIKLCQQNDEKINQVNKNKHLNKQHEQILQKLKNQTKFEPKGKNNVRETCQTQNKTRQQYQFFSDLKKKIKKKISSLLSVTLFIDEDLQKQLTVKPVLQFNQNLQIQRKQTLRLISCKFVWFHLQKNKHLSLVVFNPFNDNININGSCKFVIFSISAKQSHILHCKPLFEDNFQFLNKQMTMSPQSQQSNVEGYMLNLDYALKQSRNYNYIYLYPYMKLSKNKLLNPNKISKNQFILKFNLDYIYNSGKNRQNLTENSGQSNKNFQVYKLNSKHNLKVRNNVKKCGELKKIIQLKSLQQYVTNYKVMLGEIKTKTNKNASCLDSYQRLKRRFLRVLQADTYILQ